MCIDCACWSSCWPTSAGAAAFAALSTICFAANFCSRLHFLPRGLWQLPHLQACLQTSDAGVALKDDATLQVLSLRKNDLQWLPPDAAKMQSMQQLIVSGSDSPFGLF
jgi:hypothetical protein